MATRHPIRHDPSPDLASLRDEVARVLRERFGGTAEEAPTEAGAWCPVLDIDETDERFVVHVELPGVPVDEIDVGFEDGVLTVGGERRFYAEKDTDGFHRIERRFGAFHRSLRFRDEIDPEGVEARYDGGVLSITLPKVTGATPHRIEVRRE